MADEKKAEYQSQEAPAAEGKEQPKEDYEAKYKAQQAKQEKMAEDLRKANEMLDAVTPFVDWDAAQGRKPEEPGEVQYLSKEDMEKMRQQDRDRTENELLELRFEVANPDLKGYMKLVKAELTDARMKNPRLTKRELLDVAADNARKFLEKERQSAIEEAKKKKAAEDEIAASGLDASGTTPPATEEQGQTYQEYADEVKGDLARIKGMQHMK